jgi:hypothetical protein
MNFAEIFALPAHAFVNESAERGNFEQNSKRHRDWNLPPDQIYAFSAPVNLSVRNFLDDDFAEAQRPDLRRFRGKIHAIQPVEKSRDLRKPPALCAIGISIRSNYFPTRSSL